MEKILNILVGVLLAAAGLQIAAVHFLVRGANYSELLKGIDLTSLQTVCNLMPFLF